MGQAYLALSPDERRAKLAANTRRSYLKHIEERRAKGRVAAMAWHKSHKEEANRLRGDRYKAHMAAVNADPQRRVEHLEANRRRDKAYRDQRREALATRPKPARCEVCNGLGNKDGIVWDHCHESGRFRGWICARCNLSLGAVNDDPILLNKLADYLRSNDFVQR